jgi:hypothetical protein
LESSGISHLILQDLCVQQAKRSSSETLIYQFPPSHLPTFHFSDFRIPTSDFKSFSPSHLLNFYFSGFASSELVEGHIPFPLR